MRRLLLGVVVFIVAGIVLSVVFRDSQGYVLVSFNGWQIQTSVLFAVAAVLLSVWLLAVVWKLLTAILFAPSAIRRFRARRRAKKARRSWHEGLAYYAEAHWARAETELEDHAEAHEAPGLHHLFAARAAQHQDKPEARDTYLSAAGQDETLSELAVDMTRAELQIAAGENEAAHKTLARLHNMAPKHPWGLRLYAEHALATEQYGVLARLLPDLGKAGTVSRTRLKTMHEAAAMDALAQPKDTGALSTAWRSLSKTDRANPRIAACYARCLSALGEENEAANVIRTTLKKTYDRDMVMIFGGLAPRDDNSQLADVETWIEKHGEQPELMLVAGRLCLARQLWGRARHYLDSEAAGRVGPQAALELGRLQERLNEADEARKSYRRGLEKAVYVT